MPTLEEWKKQVRVWADDPAVRRAARRLMGGTGLGDTKRANWRKPGKEPPAALFEGAALAACALEGAGTHDARAYEQTKLAGVEFWQVFFVSSERDKNGDHACSILRCWTGVKRKAGVTQPIDFAHKTWFTGPGQATKPPISNIVGKDELETKQIGNSKAFSIFWSVADSKAHDFGYRADVDATITSRPLRNQKHEYLGGMSNMPVERTFLVASLPHSLLKRSSELLSESPFALPQCLQFNADGNPIDSLEAFLQGQVDRRMLAPWFDTHGQSAPLWKADVSIPEPIKRELSRSGMQLEGRDRSAYCSIIQSPLPYLYYSLVFELP